MRLTLFEVTVPLVMTTGDGGSTGRPRVTTDVVVDGLPQPTSADGIVAAKHLHFRIKQEEID